MILTSFSYLFMAFLSGSPPPKDGKSSKKEMCHCKYTAQENGPDKLLKQKKAASDGVGSPQRAKSHSGRWCPGGISKVHPESCTGDPGPTWPTFWLLKPGSGEYTGGSGKGPAAAKSQAPGGALRLARHLGFTSPKTQAGNYRVLVLAFISF